MAYDGPMASWSFLTNHAQAMLYLAAHPDARLRDLADALGVTERTGFAIVADLADAGYVVKEREGRRNRYHLQADLPLVDRVASGRTVGELLELLLDADQRGDDGEAAGSG